MPHNMDWFARPQNNPISPFELNNEGRGQALVLRYAGCNLRCPLCYAWRYAWKLENGYQYEINASLGALENLPQVAKKKIVWVRIQGGEPCLNYERILNTVTFAVHALSKIYQNGLNYYDNIRAIIQTNGITFSNLDISQITNIRAHLYNSLNSMEKGKVVFEVSLKSPCDSNVLNKQLSGFNVLLDQILIPLWNKGLDNISVYPVAGLGPSIDFHNVWITPIEPTYLPEEIPFFHPKTWSPAFKNMLNNFKQKVVPNYDSYKDFRNNPKTDHGRKIAIEELEPAQFQTSWISGYAGTYDQLNMSIPSISNVLRRLNNNPDRQWLALFKRNKNWLNVLNQIPVSSNPDNLLQLIQQMRDVFYPSHPIGHYPYL